MSWDLSKLKPFEEALMSVYGKFFGKEVTLARFDHIYGITKSSYEEMRRTQVNEDNFALHPGMFYEVELYCKMCDLISECKRTQIGCLFYPENPPYHWNDAKVAEEVEQDNIYPGEFVFDVANKNMDSDGPPSDGFKFDSDPEKAAKEVVDKARDTYSDDGFKRFRFKFLKEAD